ncbi:MAG: hypothetical protein HYV07_14545 [Deltaproteobacteria bacterium]|nr:hypothetical protein [Deltaproteobacteria bacterium]
MARIWSIFDRQYRLVLAVSDEPGLFNFAHLPDEDVEPVECDFATLQCYDAKAEPELLNHLFSATDLNGFLELLGTKGYKVIEGRPSTSKVARL